MTTWNPSDKDAAIVLSGGDLIATLPAVAGMRAVRGNTNFVSGKLYFEVTVNLVGVYVGWASSGYNLAGGIDTFSWGYFSSGFVWASTAGGVAGASFTNGDVIGCAIDFGAGKIWWSKNGVYQGAGANPVTGANPQATFVAGSNLFPMVSLQSGTPANAQATANFGASAFTTSPPAGFTAVNGGVPGPGAVGNDQPVSWAIRNVLGKTQTIAWGIRNTIGDDQALLWAIRAIAGDTQQLRWDIRGIIGDEQAIAWSIIISIAATPGEFSNAAALATRLISKKGRPIIIRRYSASPVGDAAKPWRVGTPGNHDHQCFAVFLDYEKQDIDGSVIKVEDKHFLVAADGLLIEPTPKDVILDNFVQWDIVNVKPLRPGSANILFDIQVRR